MCLFLSQTFLCRTDLRHWKSGITGHQDGSRRVATLARRHKRAICSLDRPYESGIHQFSKEIKLTAGSLGPVLSYRPGSCNVKPDALSRVFIKNDTETKEPEPILPTSCFVGTVIWDIEEKVKEAIQGLEGPSSCPLGLLWVPQHLQGEVIQWGHSSQLSCHPGIDRTMKFIFQRFWWEPMRPDFSEFIQACSVFNQSKTPLLIGQTPNLHSSSALVPYFYQICHQSMSFWR